jgi:Asp-tRNA(Asn)/Glu-tRNA(Gln) amidotransferase A subunit family amidase
MDEHGLDLWISPSATGPAPRGLDSTGDPIMNLPWTNAGLPTLTLPTSFNEAGLPMGLQLTGRWQADEQLFTYGKTVEEIFGHE